MAKTPSKAQQTCEHVWRPDVSFCLKCRLPARSRATSAARVLAIRSRLRLSQADFGQLLGVSFVTVNRWENGHHAPTGAAWLRIIQLEQQENTRIYDRVTAWRCIRAVQAFLRTHESPMAAEDLGVAVHILLERQGDK